MIVTVICTVEEYRVTLRPLLGNTLHMVRVSDEPRTSQDLRLDFVKSHLNFDISKEALWRVCRKKGYSYGRRTFVRDLQILEDAGELRLEVTRGGAAGKFTTIKRVGGLR